MCSAEIGFRLERRRLAVLDFGLIFVGSTAIGVCFGCFSALLYKHVDFKSNQLVQTVLAVLAVRVCESRPAWNADLA